jgi:hypothetical protein
MYFVEATAVDHDSAAELLDGGLRRLTRDLYKVCFFNTGRGLGERIGQISIVGHQQEPLGEVIETADRVKAGELVVNASDLLLGGFGKQLGNCGPILWVVEGCDIASGFVKQEVAVGFRAMEELSIYPNMVAGRIVTSAKRVNNLAVDLNTAFQNQLLGLAPGGDTGLGKNLLQPFTGGYFLRI